MNRGGLLVTMYVQWMDTEVLEANVQHLMKRRIKEAISIRRTNNLNMDCGVLS